MREENNATFNAIVDRIEGNFAVCEMPYETMVDIELSKFSFEVKENDRLHIDFDENGEIQRIIKVERVNPMRRLKAKFIRFT